MNDMLARLDASHQQQRQFVADASHELRSPVAASRVQLEVGLANPAQTDWTATATAVLAEQRHLGRLVDDLLALGRLDEGGVGSTAEVDLDDVLGRESVRSQPVPIVVDECQPVRLVGNEQLLTRLVRNLIDNAASHTATDVHVALRRNGQSATLEVDDNGPGVPPADRDRIFQRFTRIDEARAGPTAGPASAWRSPARWRVPTVATCVATTHRGVEHASPSRSPCRPPELTPPRRLHAAVIIAGRYRLQAVSERSERTIDIVSFAHRCTVAGRPNPSKTRRRCIR